MRRHMMLAVTALGLATAPVLAPAMAQDKTISLTLTGQSMIRSDLRVTAPQEVPVIQSLLTGDVKFTNFESVVALEGQTVPGGGGRGFLTPPAAFDSLGAFGFNLLSLSNNHAFDMKNDGLQNTLREANKIGIVHAGTGQTLDEAAAPAYLKTANGTVALVSSASGLMVPGAHATATTPGVNELRIHAGDKPNEANAELPGGVPNSIDAEDSARILKNIREARAHSDLVVVYQHNHVFSNRPFSAVFGEGLPERLAPPDWLKQWVHAEIDAGADLVVMHGAPLLHGIEIYKGKPIFYGIGVFFINGEIKGMQEGMLHTYPDATGHAPPPRPPSVSVREGGNPASWYDGLVPVTEYEDGRAKTIRLYPLDLGNTYDRTRRGIPHLADPVNAQRILSDLQRYSAPFGTKIAIEGSVGVIRIPS
jgi:poly-gamma-glutamate synthesis protein (capsule biosynthesis protein)